MTGSVLSIVGAHEITCFGQWAAGDIDAGVAVSGCEFRDASRRRGTRFVAGRVHRPAALGMRRQRVRGKRQCKLYRQ
jgi:hypothetical protein